MAGKKWEDSFESPEGMTRTPPSEGIGQRVLNSPVLPAVVGGWALGQSEGCESALTIFLLFAREDGKSPISARLIIPMDQASRLYDSLHQIFKSPEDMLGFMEMVDRDRGK